MSIAARICIGEGEADSGCGLGPKLLNEALDVGRVVHKRDDVGHRAAHARKDSTNILPHLAHLLPHVTRLDVAALVEGDLTLKVDDLAVSLDHSHRERPEGRPDTRRVDGVDP